MLPKNNPAETLPWQKLTAHFLSMQASDLHEFFEEDTQRFDKFHLLFEDILVDYSKNIITHETLALFAELSEECQLKEAIESMFKGIRINQTENRPVLHVALRNRDNHPIQVDG